MMGITINGVIIREQKPEKKPISVWIEPSLNADMFFCPFCRHPLFEYQGNLLKIVAGESPDTGVVKVMCQNSSCRHVFIVRFTE